MSGYDPSAISSFDFHHSMLVDSVRTESFLRAILHEVHAGDVVVDLGCGTGVLSLFAAMAGARRVYAIEREPIITLAEEIAAVNGFADRVSFIAGTSTELEIPETVDVVVSETIGNLGFDEGVLRWAADAGARFGTADTRFVPRRIDLVATLVEAPHESDTVQRWARPLLGLDFAPLRRVAVNNLAWTRLSPFGVLAEPERVFGARIGEYRDLVGTTEFTARRDGTVHGIGAWFTAELTDDITISNAPPNRVPSWDQGFLPVSEPFEVGRGDRVRATIEVSGDGASWTWRVADMVMSSDLGEISAADTGRRQTRRTTCR
jgi:SAM-dependent methyltransferase